MVIGRLLNFCRDPWVDSHPKFYVAVFEVFKCVAFTGVCGVDNLLNRSEGKSLYGHLNTLCSHH